MVNLSERSYIYKLISLGFLFPDEVLIEKIKEVLGKLKNYEDSLKKEFLLFWNSIDISNLKNLQNEYSRLFGSNQVCSLNITDYISSHELMQVRQIADISGFYKAFGLEIIESERHDNISVCFEFLSFLLLKEIHASSNNNDKIDIVKDAFKKFFNEYITNFTEKFVKKLNENSNCLFYNNLSVILDKFINQEKQTTCNTSVIGDIW